MAIMEIINNQIIFISALPQELKSLQEDIVSEVTFNMPPITALSGHINNQEVILLSTGCGPKSASVGIDFIIQNYKPKIIVNIGYAGGAHPDLSAGDVIIPSAVYSESGESVVVDDCMKTLAIASATSAVLKYKECNTVSVSNIIDQPQEKAMWGTRFNAWAIDMETYYVAKACKKNNIPCVIARVILDPLSFKLPDNSMLRNDGSICWGSIFKSMITEPMTLFKLAGKQSVADESISKFLRTLLPLVLSIDFGKSCKEIKDSIKIASQSIS